jgi:hypothetical protein
MRKMSRTKAPWVRVLTALVPVFCLACFGISPAHAQFTAPYVVLQGTLTTASGTAAKNAVLTLTPSQVFFVAGSQVVVGSGQCYTDTSGSLHGLPTPAAPRVTAQGGIGTLPASNYYVKFAWYDQWGAITLTSPEVAVQLLVTGELQILPPVGNGPPNAVGMKVYISTTPGAETLQGATLSTTAQYTQSTSLVTGANPPIMNLTSCAFVANDAGWPTGTGYMAALVDASGNPLFTYPEMWQLLSPGSAYNLANGIPYYHGQVTYPVPILTVPYNHNPQSISGPVAFTNYNIYDIGAIGVGTSLPAWGVDVEGSGLLGMVNAAGGYLAGGNGGSVGQCLLSDGTAFNTPGNCVTTLPTLFYQTIEAAGTSQTQRPALNFLAPYFSLSDSASPARTNVNVVVAGTDTKLATTAASGTSGNAVIWDSNGGIADAGAPPLLTTSHTVVGFWQGTSCTFVDDGATASACVGTQSWGTTLPSTYYYWCQPDIVADLYPASCGNLGDCTGVSFNRISQTTTDFTYALAQRLANPRGHSVQMTCWATN